MTDVRILLFTLLLCPLALQADALSDVVGERLSMMKSVAAWKWERQLPVTDPAREQVVIDQAIRAGLRYGITVDSSRDFFTVQISAAREIQHCWMTRWQENPPDTDPPDLNTVIRPRLIELGERITALLATEDADRASFESATRIDCLTPETRNNLFRAMQSVTRYPHRLAQVMESGILRVGTTGDYAPFSHQASADSHFEGIDIKLARDLAASLGVEVRFVKTTWPGLMEDLRTGQYDIAMSGVSRTVPRATKGYFSAAYHVGGKTPIVRCDEVSRYATLPEINQPTVRAVVNPGGTNERFLDSRLDKVTKVLHDDNRTIFDEILAGRADLMVTDAIEVRLQTALRPGLCAAMPGQTLTYQEKGYLMPQDEPLRSAVDLWLAQRLGDGTVERIFDAHLSP